MTVLTKESPLKERQALAIDLLRNTLLNYEEISKRSSVPLGSLGAMALKHRPEHIREKMKRKNADVTRALRVASAKIEKVEVPYVAPEPKFEQKPEFVAANPDAVVEKTSSKGVITRSITFNYTSKGENISAEDFIEELRASIATIQDHENESITYSLTIEAK